MRFLLTLYYRVQCGRLSSTVVSNSERLHKATRTVTALRDMFLDELSNRDANMYSRRIGGLVIEAQVCRSRFTELLPICKALHKKAKAALNDDIIVIRIEELIKRCEANAYSLGDTNKQ